MFRIEYAEKFNNYVCMRRYVDFLSKESKSKSKSILISSKYIGPYKLGLYLYGVT